MGGCWVGSLWFLCCGVRVLEVILRVILDHVDL